MSRGARRPWGLCRDYRLRKTDEFSSVFRFRRVCRGVCVDLHVMPNALNHARLGLAVPRRVIRLASERNRLKRLMREQFRLSRDGLPSLDIVARVKAVCPEDRFKAEFLSLLVACRVQLNSEPSPKQNPT